MRFILEFDTLAAIDDTRIREVVDAYLQGECDGVTAANKLGWEFSTWQTYMAEVINLTLYLAPRKNSDMRVKPSEALVSKLSTVGVFKGLTLMSGFIVIPC